MSSPVAAIDVGGRDRLLGEQVRVGDVAVHDRDPAQPFGEIHRPLTVALDEDDVGAVRECSATRLPTEPPPSTITRRTRFPIASRVCNTSRWRLAVHNTRTWSPAATWEVASRDDRVVAARHRTEQECPLGALAAADLGERPPDEPRFGADDGAEHRRTPHPPSGRPRRHRTR
ncbi:MAG: hypothetical protein R2705_21855 [Ilumatobacteraceae bacterium]